MVLLITHYTQVNFTVAIHNNLYLELQWKPYAI
jgi:hypothetical protein